MNLCDGDCDAGRKIQELQQLVAGSVVLDVSEADFPRGQGGLAACVGVVGHTDVLGGQTMDFAKTCECEDLGDCIMRVEGGVPELRHEACGRRLDISDPADEIVVENVPVAVEYWDFGWSPATPDGPAEHNGWEWVVTSRTF